MQPSKIVTYKRVSTDKQGIKGLGINAQQMQIQQYLSGVDHILVKEFAEVSSGTKKGLKPELKQAIKLCKETGATLVFAKLDRMTRSVKELCEIRDSGIKFVSADQPSASKVVIDILISLGEDEAERISTRTKAALQALKQTKVTKTGKVLDKLGTPRNLTNEAKMKGTDTVNANKKEKADEFAKQIAPLVYQLQLKNFSLNKIAKALNSNSIPTATGKLNTWDACKVSHIVKRMEASHMCLLAA